MTKVVNSQTWAQKLLEDIILLPLDLVLMFCVTFSGDYTVSGVPLFFIFWLVILVIRRNFRLEKIEILAQIFMIFTLLPILFQADKYSLAYYLGSYYPIFYINAVVFAKHIVDRLLSDSPGVRLVRWLPAMSILFFGALIQRIDGDISRLYLLFGPNVLYRIIAVTFFLHLVLFSKHYTSRKLGTWSAITNLFITIVSLSIAIYCMVKTGSRGATILGGIMLLSFIYSVLNIKIKWLKLTSLAVIVCLTVFILTSNFSSYISEYRGLWFYDRGSSSYSIDARKDFWHNLPSFFLKDNYLLGEGSEYQYFYPHNLYLDMLYNAGILPFLIILAFTATYIIILVFRQGQIPRNWKILTLVLLLPIYTGSLVSGTLYDNYPAISMIIMFPIWMQNYIRTKYAKNRLFLDRG